MAGRPRSFDRDAAVELALDAFWERGYAGTSIAELTATMGIAPPSLYAAFGDKQRLFAEACERYVGNLHASLETVMALPTARESIERALRDCAAWYTAGSRQRGCLVMSEPLLAAERDASRAAFAARLQTGLEAGELAPGTDVEALAGFVDVVLAGMSARARDGATQAELEAAVDVALAAWPGT